MKTYFCILSMLLLCITDAFAEAPSQRKANTMQSATLDSIALKTIEGKEVHLSDTPFAGKVLLIVNTASKCGYTPQYESLEKLYQTYKSRGLVVLGFPSNDFGAQEPGTDSDIKQFCQLKYNVDFPLFTKNPVTGSAIQPLYAWLLQHSASHDAVKWNFEKFLVSRHHEVIGRYKSSVAPDSAELTAAIEKALAL